MKPLFLTIQGINSYEEKQEVDFEKLTPYGLFGIFGPTGSGKSTVLDAMTIALYGKAARYSSNVQKQFINANLNKAEVFFKFESNGSVYCVQRSYRRSEAKKETATVRFYRTTRSVEGTLIEEVLADKNETEVTKSVSGVVGLEYEDFIRSVALPQGKFADFLLLHESDRRKMLERILGLEQYGKKLSDCVKKFENESRGRIDGYTKAVAALGDISFGMLENMEKEAVNGEKAVKALKEEYAEKSVLFERYRLLAADYALYSEALLKLGKLNGKKNEINEKKERAAAAKKAESLHDTVIEMNKTKERLSSMVKERDGLAESAAVAAKNLEVRRDGLENIKNQKDAELKAIAVTEGNLRQAEQLAAEIEVLDAQLKAAQAEYKTTNGQMLSVKQKQVLIIETMTNDEKTLERWDSKKKEIAYSSSERQTLFQAVEYEKEIFRLNVETEKIRKKIAAAQIGFEKFSKQREALSKEAEKTGIDIQTKMEFLNEIKQKINVVETQIKSCAAVYLSRSLKDGVPCPVCGSAEHPNPGGTGESGHSELSDLEGERDRLEVLFKETERETEILKAATQMKRLETERVSVSLENVDTTVKTFSEESASIENEKARFMRLLSELDVKSYTPSVFGSFLAYYEKIRENDSLREKIERDEEMLKAKIKLDLAAGEKMRDEIVEYERQLSELTVTGREKRNVYNDKMQSLKNLTDGKEIKQVAAAIEEAKKRIEIAEINAKREYEGAYERERQLSQMLAGQSAAIVELKERLTTQAASFAERLQKNGFGSESDVLNAYMPLDDIHRLEAEIKNYEIEVNGLKMRSEDLEKSLEGEVIAEIPVKHALYSDAVKMLANDIANISEENAVRTDRIKRLTTDLAKMGEILEKKSREEERCGYLSDLTSLFRANSFLAFVAERQLQYVAAEAGRRLKKMTGGRFAIEIDNTGFIIRDDNNCGVRRPPSSLSGGEIFMASLCLALALSSKIQMRSGANLRFFFMDEGFGALDSSLLDTVMDALETLRGEQMAVGLITHVAELKSRIPAKLVIEPAHHGMRGSAIRTEIE